MLLRNIGIIYTKVVLRLVYAQLQSIITTYCLRFSALTLHIFLFVMENLISSFLNKNTNIDFNKEKIKTSLKTRLTLPFFDAHDFYSATKICSSQDYLLMSFLNKFSNS